MAHAKPICFFIYNSIIQTDEPITTAASDSTPTDATRQEAAAKNKEKMIPSISISEIPPPHIPAIPVPPPTTNKPASSSSSKMLWCPKNDGENLNENKNSMSTGKKWKFLVYFIIFFYKEIIFLLFQQQKKCKRKWNNKFLSIIIVNCN